MRPLLGLGSRDRDGDDRRRADHRRVVQIVFGTYDRAYTTPIAQGVYTPWGIHIAKFDLLTIGVAVGGVRDLRPFFRFTSMGLQMRAAAESNEAAALSGSRSAASRRRLVGEHDARLRLREILANKTQIVNISLADLGLYAFPAVVIGGLESVPGAIIGGLVVGLLESFSAATSPPTPRRRSCTAACS